MILTGPAIRDGVQSGVIVIDPFHEECLEPNSYRFHLGESLLVYRADCIDAYDPARHKLVKKIRIPSAGYVLRPGRFYLGSTAERMGSFGHAAELYARLSTSLLGMFIQTSAPLGHTGAIIPWTLEIVVTQCVRVYARMPVGKICFWENFGSPTQYDGRYNHSHSVVHSLMSAAAP